MCFRKFCSARVEEKTFSLINFFQLLRFGILASAFYSLLHCILRKKYNHDLDLLEHTLKTAEKKHLM